MGWRSNWSFAGPFNLELVSIIWLSTWKGCLLVLGNHWFYPSEDNGENHHGLWARVSQYLNARKIKKSSSECIQNLLQLILIGISLSHHRTWLLSVVTLTIAGILENISLVSWLPRIIRGVLLLDIQKDLANRFIRTLRRWSTPVDWSSPYCTCFGVFRSSLYYLLWWFLLEWKAGRAPTETTW